MARYRKRRFRRRFKRRGVFRRRFGRRFSRRSRRYRTPTIHLKRIIRTGTLNTATSAVQAYVKEFTLAQMPNVGEYSVLFELYRLNKVSIKFIPSQTIQEAPGLPAISAPNIGSIISVIDYTDVSVPGTQDQLLQYSTAKRHRHGRAFTRTFRPAVANEIYQSSAFTGYSPKWKQWISTDYLNIPHYGFKLWMDATPVSFSYEIWTTYYFSLKGTK